MGSVRALTRRHPNSALGQALKDGLVTRNVADAVDPPQVTKDEAKPLLPEQVDSLLLAAKSMGRPRKRHVEWLTTTYDLFFAALHTGVRRGELLALRWQEVGLADSAIRIERTMNKREGEIEIKPPKSKMSRRTIPIDEEAVAFFRELRSRNPHELVLCHVDGSPLDPSAVTHLFSRMAKRLGITEASFHDQRHTYATIGVEHGVDLPPCRNSWATNRLPQPASMSTSLMSGNAKQQRN